MLQPGCAGAVVQISSGCLARLSMEIDLTTVPKSSVQAHTLHPLLDVFQLAVSRAKQPGTTVSPHSHHSRAPAPSRRLQSVRLDSSLTEGSSASQWRELKTCAAEVKTDFSPANFRRR